MSLQLAPHIHMVAIRDDLVILDTQADSYFCWVGGSSLVTPQTDGSVAVDGLEAEEVLRASRFLTDRSTHPSRSAMVLPIARTSLEQVTPEGRAPLLKTLGLMINGLGAARDFHRVRFHELIAWAVDRRAEDSRRFEPPTPALLREANAFLRGRVWSFANGACLLRSYLMLRYLRAHELDAAWVIGVRTWPFYAHCWLQVGDVVLDEDIERLAAFTPILVA